MKKAKMTAAVLAAVFAFAAAPVFDAEVAGKDGVVGVNGVSGISLFRPVYAEAQTEAVDYDPSLWLLPLTTHTRYFVDGDEKGILLRSHWTGISTYNKDYEGPKPPMRIMGNALENYSLNESRSFDKSRQKLIGDAKNDRDQRLANGATFFGPYQEDGDIFVRRADFRVVSFLEDGYSYLGGAHGLGGVVGRNFDVYTGKELKLTDVITDKAGLAEAIKQQLMLDYPDSSFAQNGGASMRETVDQMVEKDQLLWSLDPRGISFYFNPYLLGSYAEGLFTTTLFFSERPELFVKNESSDVIDWRGPQNYCMELRPYMSIRLSDSSRNERIHVGNDDTCVMIEYCGKALRDVIEVKEIRPVFVNCYDGRKYLYVDYAKMGNDFRLRVYDLNGEKPKFIGEFPMTRLASSPKDKENRNWYIMSDTNDFFMTATEDTNLIPGKRLRCRVGQDGRPEVFEVEGAVG